MRSARIGSPQSAGWPQLLTRACASDTAPLPAALQEFKTSDFPYNKKKVAQLLTVLREQQMAENPAGGSSRKLRSEEKCGPRPIPPSPPVPGPRHYDLYATKSPGGRISSHQWRQPRLEN